MKTDIEKTDSNKKALNKQAFGGLLQLIIALTITLFVPAQTFNYWQAWVFLAVFSVSVLAITVYLMKHDPKLLERRVKAGPDAEKERGQKVIQSIASLAFVAIFVCSALDHRFVWSRVPLYMVVAGDGLVVLGLLIVFCVFRANTFASATIEVAADQPIISTGPYKFVRHPMYAGALIMLLGVPLALGSWWGLLAVALIKLALLWRLLDEERFLAKSLPGYAEYRTKVRYRLVPFIWLQIAFACGLTLAFRPAHAQRANLPLPTPGSIGVNIHFNDPRSGEMEELAAAGFHWIRQDFSWAGIEREKGHYDFSAYERLLAALKPHRIRPIFILDYGNDLYEQGSPRTPESRAAFARFAAAAVSHFRGQGILWEMWNEPNIGFWKPKPNVDEYIALALETGKAIRRAAPAEWYIGPGVSGMDFAFIERCCKAGLLAYWDAVSFHPYRDSRPETAAADYLRLREILTRFAPPGKTVPILSSEWGYSELYAGLNRELQSKYIAREFLTNQMNGLLLSIWYDWHDDGTDPKEPEHHFGVVTNDYQAKPAYTAAQTLARQLDGYRYNKRLALDSPDDYCLLFSNGAQQRLVLWTIDTKPHAVDIPTGAGDFQVIDTVGHTSTEQARAHGLHLILTDAPQYLIPTRGNPRLALAAAWHTMPATLYSDDRLNAGMVIDPLKEIRGAQLNTLRLARLHIQPVNRDGALPPDREKITSSGFTLSLEGENDHQGLDASRIGLAADRDERPLMLRATLQVDGMDLAAQEFEVRPRHPLRVTLLPAVGAILPVRVENPTGAPFNGRVRLTAGQTGPATPLRLAADETEQVVDLPFVHEASGEYTVGCEVEEAQKGRMPWPVVVSAPAQRFTSLESFGAYASGDSLHASDYQIVADGDPKVRSQITGTVVDAPPGLTGGGAHALRIAYDFAPGWKFLRLARTLDLPGTPNALGMWVYGDGSGDLLRARFTDSTGQTFQPDGGTVDWKGWRYIRFPLQGEVGGHWGGANDAVIHYPIRLDTALLVDSPGQHGGKGVISVTDITLIGPADR